jgi:hypothetical protein
MFPHPKVDYDDGRSLFPSGATTLTDQLLRMVADKRTDSAKPDAALEYEGKEAWGNPDRYGPNPAPVRVTGIMQPATVYQEEELKIQRAE